MKKYIFILLTFNLLFANISLSQTRVTKVVYKIVSNKSSSNDKISDTRTKGYIAEVNKYISEVEYNLICDNKSSLFFLNKSLRFEDEFGYKIAAKLGGAGIYYNNDSLRIVNKTKGSKKVNIIYPLIIDKWKIHSESKVINGYLCYKATSERIVKDRNGNKKIFYPEVWFTNEIALPFGPKDLNGLPGLVLEGTINNNIVFYVSKVDFNCNECVHNLKLPKGDFIEKEDYYKKIKT